MNYIEAREKLREAKRQALANSCNIKVGRRELEVALDVLSKPDMREKVKEYISELDAEIDRCNREMEELESDETVIDEVRDKVELCNITRIQTLTDVKNDLQGRLEELV